jgi:hypothetical protein
LKSDTLRLRYYAIPIGLLLERILLLYFRLGWLVTYFLLIDKVPSIAIADPVSLIREGPMWSSARAFVIRPGVNPGSLPIEPVFGGPPIRIAELYPSADPDGDT